MEPMGFEQCFKQALINLHNERDEWNENLAPAGVCIGHEEALWLLARSHTDFRLINSPVGNLSS